MGAPQADRSPVLYCYCYLLKPIIAVGGVVGNNSCLTTNLLAHLSSSLATCSCMHLDQLSHAFQVAFRLSVKIACLPISQFASTRDPVTFRVLGPLSWAPLFLLPPSHLYCLTCFQSFLPVLHSANRVSVLLAPLTSQKSHISCNLLNSISRGALLLPTPTTR